MDERRLPTEDEIKEELKRHAADQGLVSEELVEELYDKEKEYSTMERRQGITRAVRQLIESHVDTDEI
ncbi:DNA modification system-associated small protein [Halomicrococcus sp. NG-SE-24]|uniref:DNA modification system-associated small protein n=1 Tax=Halomicrococcus sp. NG-SE-24 TaxID=3436928 RepID=UPI003D956B4D